MSAPIISVEQMRAWEDASWAAGRDQKEVIERVGHLVARRALRITRDEDRILVLAGMGHNGDDARAAVPHLINRRVKLLEIADPTAALEELERLLQKRPNLVIDALFGIGLNRELAPAWIRVIEAINHARLAVLAVDVPSGLNAATGKPEGAAIEAALTLTVGAIKRGMLAESAVQYVGRLELAPEIGLAPHPENFKDTELRWIDGEEFGAFTTQRTVTSHKGAFGHLAIIAGSLGYHGAAVLASRGAAQAHPGLVTLVTQAESYIPAASQLQSTMVHPWPAAVRVEEFCSALLVGPGLAARSLPADIKPSIKRYWRTLPQPMVVDASALEWLEPGPTPAHLIRVITPHPGEASRMLGVSAQAVQADRPAAVRALSDRFGHCWVALKGHQTIVGCGKNPAHVNSTGNPFLAQGGSGDVLAGFLGGLLAQPEFQKDPGRTARFAVWTHGAAADLLSERHPGWTVEELAETLGRVPRITAQD